MGYEAKEMKSKRPRDIFQLPNTQKKASRRASIEDEPQIHLNKRFTMQHLYYNLLPFCHSSNKIEVGLSAMYDCKVFNYSLPSKCINKLLNIIAPARAFFTISFRFQ